MADRAGGHDAREGADALAHIHAEPFAKRWPVEVRLRKRHGDEQDVRGIETRIHGHKAREALDHETGGGEHDERERHLACDETGPDESEPARDRTVAGSLEVGPPQRGNGSQAEQDSGRHRHEARERQDPRIEMDGRSGVSIRSVGDAGRQHAGHQRRSRCRDSDAHRTANNGDDKRFAQDLAGNAPTRRAKRGTDGELVPTRGGLREQQVGHVEARDGQDQGDRTRERDERGAQLHDAEIAHGRERRRFVPIIVRILFRERPAERVELGLRRSRADAWPQSRRRLEGVRAAPAVFLVERNRRPHRGLAVHKSERGRHHPDDLERTPVDPRDGADDVRTTAIAALPQTEADDCHIVSGPIFFVLERPAHERRDAKHPERRRRHAQAGHALRFHIAREIEVQRLPDRGLLEGLDAAPPVLIIGSAHDIDVVGVVGGGFPQHHEALRIAKGQRLEQQGSDDAEDGGVGADAEAEREHRDGGESRPRGQHAHGVADVAPRGGHEATDARARRRHHIGGGPRRSVELLARQRERVFVALPSRARGAPGLLDMLGELLDRLIRQRA